jgi:hypothetical protein
MRAPVVKPATLRLAQPLRQAPAVMLGVFILWQLAFLVLANLLEFFPHRVHRLDEFTSYREYPAEAVNPSPLVHALPAVTDCWSQLTGQYQMWWLFAPDFPRQATFPVVELRWDDPATGSPPVLLLSSLEPANTASYFHPPNSCDRLLHYEAYLGLGLEYWNDPTEPADVDAWRKILSDVVRSQWKSIRAYLRWRIADFRARHPELPPPDEARLLIRIYPTPTSGAARGDRLAPRDLPFARWRCNENESSSTLSVEEYDPFSGRYVSLPFPPGQLRPANFAPHE